MTAYVTNENNNTVTPIDLATNTAGTAIPVGATPTAVASTPDGTRAYVTNGGGNYSGDANNLGVASAWGGTGGTVTVTQH